MAYQACVVANSDATTYALGAAPVGAKMVRYETAASADLDMAVINSYSNSGCEVLLLAGIDGLTDTSSLAKLTNWARNTGPGSGITTPSRYIELGNEMMYSYPPKPGASYAPTYGRMCANAYAAIQAGNPQVKLLAMADVGNDDPTSVINAMFAANRSLASQVWGWTFHSYGKPDPSVGNSNDWINNMAKMVAALRANGVANPRLFLTEDGVQTDNGRTLNTNKGPVSYTYAQAADYWTQKVAAVKAQPWGSLVEVHCWFESFDQQKSGTSNGQDDYYGAVKSRADGLARKDPLTSTIASWIVNNPPTTSGGGGGGAKTLTASPSSLSVLTGAAAVPITVTPNGFTTAGLEWSVNGVVKGNLTVGTITLGPAPWTTASYLPPAAVPASSVSIRASDIASQGTAAPIFVDIPVAIANPPVPAVRVTSFEDTFTGTVGSNPSAKWAYTSRFTTAPAAQLDGSGRVVIQSKSSNGTSYASGILQYADALDCSGKTQRLRVTWRLNAGGPAGQVARLYLGKTRDLMTPKDLDTDLIWVDTDGTNLTINQRVGGVDRPVLSTTAAPAAGTFFDLWFEIGPTNWRVRQDAGTWLIGGSGSTVPHGMTYANAIALAFESASIDATTASGMTVDLVRFGPAVPDAPTNPTALASGGTTTYTCDANAAGDYVTAYTFALTGLGTQYTGASPSGTNTSPSTGTYPGTVTASNDWATSSSTAFTLVVGAGAPPPQAINGASDLIVFVDYPGTVTRQGSDLQEVLTEALGLLTTGAAYEAANLATAQTTPPPSDDDRAASRLQLANQGIAEVNRALTALGLKG